MGILLGLLAAISLGISDFLARFSTKVVGTYRTLLYVQPVGLVGLSAYWLASGLLLKQREAASWQAWAWAGVVVVLNLLSTLAFYRSLQVGMISVVSSIAASYAVVIVFLSVLTGEQLSLSHGLGIGAALVGVVLAATIFPEQAKIAAGEQKQRRRRGWPPGVGLAVAAALGYAVTYWLLGTRVAPQLGPFVAVWLVRFITPCILVMCAGPFHQSLRVPRGAAWWFIGGVGLFETVGYVASISGLATEQIAIVGVLTSLFSAVTILLAWMFLRERLQWSQWLGVGIIFMGIVLVNIKSL